MAKRKVIVKRRMGDEDFAEAPPTEAQQGEMAADSSYNEMVEPVNNLMKSGETLRRRYSEETLKRMQADEAAYDKSPGRTPQSEDNTKKRKMLVKLMRDQGATELPNDATIAAVAQREAMTGDIESAENTMQYGMKKRKAVVKPKK